jgi:hypothetical protein
MLCILSSAEAATVNVSQGKAATASSLWGGTSAGLAVDGATQADWPNFHCAEGDFNPWWKVDLGRFELIKSVVLWNRTQCCQIRLRDLIVEILDENEHILYVSPRINPDGIEGGPVSLTLTLDSAVRGQFVRVRRIPYDTSLHDGYILCLNEVQVFADTDASSTAGRPSPFYGETDVPLNASLEWDASMIVDPGNADAFIANPAVSKHVVYFSNGMVDDPNLFVLGEVAAGETRGTYGPMTLNRDGVYYWRVDEIISDTNVITGPLWTFDVVKSEPTIDASTPQNIQVNAGEDAVFSITATNPFTGDASGLGYAWFRITGTGDVAVGGDSPGLTISNAAVEDEGQYYCRVTILANGKSKNSRSAILTIKRLLHHWPFDGDMKDIVGGRDGVAVGDPDLSVEGISGTYAVDLDADDAVSIGGAEELLNYYSISAWVRHRGLANDFQSLLHQDGWTTNTLHWHLRSDKSISWGVSGAGGDGRTAAGVLPDADRWYHLVLANEYGLVRAYVDGLLVLESMQATPVSSRLLPGTLGAWNNGGTYDRFLNGAIDDIRIYNYAMDALEVALLTAETTGKSICLTRPEFDLNGDCRATLEDFALMAASWMECNRVPTSACE